jgi:RNA polymerase sigma-70 factor, ECF subfamily
MTGRLGFEGLGEDGQPFPEGGRVVVDDVVDARSVVFDSEDGCGGGVVTPVERLAFVLHDLFDLPFEEIAPLVDRTPAATRQLASRARRRVKGAEPSDLNVDVTRQRHVVDAFFAAARHGDFDGLVAVLHPDVILRIDAGPRLRGASIMLQGAASVAEQTAMGLASVLARPVVSVHPAVINGGAGVVVTANGRPVTVMGFTVHNGRIVEIDSIADPDRVPRIAASLIDITSEESTASE